MMNIFQYRRITITPDWEEVILELSTSEAEKYRELFSNRRAIDRHCQNHPLVNSKDAFWKTSKNLCVGYRLNSNRKIFRPIFSHRRQDLINEFQKHIQEGVLKREEKALWLELVRIKRLPLEIVNAVFEYVVMTGTNHIFGKFNLADLC